MATADKKLLTFLNDYGIGTYATINQPLINIFPRCAKVETYLEQQVAGRVIIDFLESLVKEQLIQIENEGHTRLLEGSRYKYNTLKNHPIRAMLLTKGAGLLNHLPPTTQIIVTGDHNNLANQSPYSFGKTGVADPPYQVRSKQTEKKRTRSAIEMTAWITGIIVSVIVIYQTFVHAPVEVKNPVSAADSIKSRMKDSPGIKHASLIKGHSSGSIPNHYSSRNKSSSPPPGSRPDTAVKKTGNSPLVTAVTNPLTGGQPVQQKAVNQDNVNDLRFKPEQRHVNIFDIRDLQSRIGNKSATITIFCGVNRECKVYAAEIRKSLDSMGYLVAPKILTLLTDRPVKRFEIDGVVGSVFIHVYPQYQY
jgi:hypothetical protein